MPETVTRATVLVSDYITATGLLVKDNEDGTAKVEHIDRNGRETKPTGKLVWLEGTEGE